jgi:hypothetical protein
MARAADASQAAISKIEAGQMAPSFALLQRVLWAAKMWIVVVDEQGRVVEPMKDRPDVRDGAERRYPSHLDTILDPEPGEWWGDQYGLTSPPETFWRNRDYRDERRRRSVWEVRVGKYRHVPPPRDPFAWVRRDAFLAGFRRGRGDRQPPD